MNKLDIIAVVLLILAELVGLPYVGYVLYECVNTMILFEWRWDITIIFGLIGLLMISGIAFVTYLIIDSIKKLKR